LNEKNGFGNNNLKIYKKELKTLKELMEEKKRNLDFNSISHISQRDDFVNDKSYKKTGITSFVLLSKHKAL